MSRKNTIYIKKSDALDCAELEGAYKAMMYISRLPAEDVKPVKHGKWNEIYHDSENYSAICTYCQEPTVRRVWFRPYDFCPHCGARMDFERIEKNENDEI